MAGAAPGELVTEHEDRRQHRSGFVVDRHPKAIAGEAATQRDERCGRRIQSCVVGTSSGTPGRQTVERLVHVVLNVPRNRRPVVRRRHRSITAVACPATTRRGANHHDRRDHRSVVDHPDEDPHQTSRTCPSARIAAPTRGDARARSALRRSCDIRAACGGLAMWNGRRHATEDPPPRDPAAAAQLQVFDLDEMRPSVVGCHDHRLGGCEARVPRDQNVVTYPVAVGYSIRHDVGLRLEHTLRLAPRSRWRRDHVAGLASDGVSDPGTATSVTHSA